MELWLLNALIVATAGAIVWFALKHNSNREAEETLADLGDDSPGMDEGVEEVSKRFHLDPNDKLSAIGLFSTAERRQFERAGRRIPLLGIGIAALPYVAFGGRNLSTLFAVSVAGFLVAYIVSGSRYRRRKQKFLKELEYHLPLATERIVMAVEAGLDILPGLEAVLAVERPDSGETDDAVPANPVSRLLDVVCRLTSAGLSFEKSLHAVAGAVECPALRHAFIHLAVAYHEGGEVIVPLRELSDATQLYYQESLEEVVAKLPVKATMPLLCTFAGLIICFITSPLIQVMKVAMKAMPQ